MSCVAFSTQVVFLHVYSRVCTYSLCTISLAIPYVSHLFVLIFVQHAFGVSKNCRRGQSAKITSVVSNAKMISMWFFIWWSFIFLMHHTPIKTIGYVTDVIGISCWKNQMPSMTSKCSHRLIKLLMLTVFQFHQRISLQRCHRLTTQLILWLI